MEIKVKVPNGEHCEKRFIRCSLLQLESDAVKERSATCLAFNVLLSRKVVIGRGEVRKCKRCLEHGN